MNTLIEKLKAATGPSAELDGEIWLQFGSDAGVGRAWNYTASIDAALALVEEVLPGWSWVLNKQAEFSLWTEEFVGTLPRRQIDSDHKSPAIAILIALLNEIQGEQTQPQTKTQEAE